MAWPQMQVPVSRPYESVFLVRGRVTGQPFKCISKGWSLRACRHSCTINAEVRRPAFKLRERQRTAESGQADKSTSVRVENKVRMEETGDKEVSSQKDTVPGPHYPPLLQTPRRAAQHALGWTVAAASVALLAAGVAHAAVADNVVNFVAGAVPESVTNAVTSTVVPVAERTAAFIPGSQR